MPQKLNQFSPTKTRTTNPQSVKKRRIRELGRPAKAYFFFAAFLAFFGAFLATSLTSGF